MSMFRIPRRSHRTRPSGPPRRRALELELLEMRCLLNGKFTPIGLPRQGTDSIAPTSLGTLLLLPDGTVLAHGSEQPDTTSSLSSPKYFGGYRWWRLSPGLRAATTPTLEERLGQK